LTASPAAPFCATSRYPWAYNAPNEEYLRIARTDFRDERP
jgi:hypothetical protein